MPHFIVMYNNLFIFISKKGAELLSNLLKRSASAKTTTDEPSAKHGKQNELNETCTMTHSSIEINIKEEPSNDVISNTLEMNETPQNLGSITIKHIFQDNTCFHEVAIPPNEEISPLKEATMPAKTYNFELDPFQKRACLCVENNQSVLVSAHTSSGKTAIAAYVTNY